MRQRAAALLLTGLLSGCASLSGLMGDEDNAEPPAQLEEINATVSSREAKRS